MKPPPGMGTVPMVASQHVKARVHVSREFKPCLCTLAHSPTPLPPPQRKITPTGI
ncbi:hypothetical protein T484DRAFT_1952732 [Baffinella frigidus]|nr:hypothetical protein T484DRAFT_1952732 [Cryptophyta sp. CCMP2293]